MVLKTCIAMYYLANGLSLLWTYLSPYNNHFLHSVSLKLQIENLSIISDRIIFSNQSNTLTSALSSFTGLQDAFTQNTFQHERLTNIVMSFTQRLFPCLHRPQDVLGSIPFGGNFFC